MKRAEKVSNTVGVTLLEVMLVLAIAALIIVMSIRYFASASISQQANAFVSIAQAIAAAEVTQIQETGQIAVASVLAKSGAIPPGIVLSAGVATLPWGSDTVTITSTGPGSNGFVIWTNHMPTAVCTLVKAILLIAPDGSTTSGGNWSIADPSIYNTTCGALQYSAT